MAEELEFPELIMNASSSLYKIYKKLGTSPAVSKQQKNEYLIKSITHHEVWAAMKDSIFNEEKVEEIGKLRGQWEFGEALKETARQEQEQARIEAEQTNRRHRWQYSGSFAFIIMAMLLVVFSGKMQIPVNYGETLLLLAFLLLFEFVLVITDPALERFTGGEPLYKFAINSFFAILLTTLHRYFEPRLKERLFKVKRGRK